MIEVVDLGPPLSEGDLQRIELTMRAKLPDRYRSFLLAHNGGQPNPDTIDIPNWPCQTTDVSVFYGILPELQACNIFRLLENLEGCKENQLLPFASDSGANQFVIVMGDDNYGQIYYFDASEIPPRPYFVANDFNEFLGKLREPTPEELADIDNAARGPEDG